MRLHISDRLHPTGALSEWLARERGYTGCARDDALREQVRALMDAEPVGVDVPGTVENLLMRIPESGEPHAPTHQPIV